MENKFITAIVPRLPPTVDGLGDYSFALAKKLKADFNIETVFIVCDPNWTEYEQLDGFKVFKISSRSKKELIKILNSNKLNSNNLLLHYVGYGYAKRGCPFWLVNALAQWKNADKKRKITTMFHEVYAFGPIWNTQFWTFPVQKLLASKLCLMSDHCLTSKGEYAIRLSKMSDKSISDIPVLPVFSNIGEPERVLPLIQREKRIVIFGTTGSRSRLYKESILNLSKVCQKYKINEIWDIGPSLNFAIPSIDNIIIKSLGIKSVEEISQILSHSFIGYLNYPSSYLCKSGIFAAFCSHGILPIVSFYEDQIVDGPVEQEHFLLDTDKENVSKDLFREQKIADNAYLWYKSHSLAAHAKSFSHFLK